MNGVRFLSKIAVAAGFALALAFTFSCSSDGGGSEPTYYYIGLGIKNCSALEIIKSDLYSITNLSFKNVKDGWKRIAQLDGDFIESGTGKSELSLRNDILKNLPPSDLNPFMDRVKSRGNGIAFFGSRVSYYCEIVYYIERE